MTWIDTSPGTRPSVRCDYCLGRFDSASNVRPVLPPNWGSAAIPGKHVCPDCEPRDAEAARAWAETIKTGSRNYAPVSQSRW